MAEPAKGRRLLTKCIRLAIGNNSIDLFGPSRGEGNFLNQAFFLTNE